MSSTHWQRPEHLCLLLAITICMGASIPSSAQVLTRAASFGGTGADFGNTIRVTPSGDRYFTGYFSNSVTFGRKTLVSAGDTDAYLAKFDRWVVQIGGAGHDEGWDIAFDDAGNVYICGWFNNSATFHSTSGASITATGSGETIFLAKYSSAGVVQWVQTGTNGSFGVNRGFGLAVDSASGTITFTGMTQTTTTFSSANGILNSVPGPWTWHMFLVRYDTNGNFQWGEWNEAYVNSVPHRVSVDASGNAYVVGWFEGGATFHGENGTAITVNGLSQPIQSYPDYPDDSFVAKYDVNGNILWVNDIGGYKAILNDVTVSSTGKVSVTGLIGNIDGTAQQQETIVGSQSPGAAINLGSGRLTTPFNHDIVVASYDENGVLLSATRIDEDNEEGGSIISDGDDVYISGRTGCDPYNPCTSYLYIAKLTSGSIDWVNQDGGPISDAPGYEALPRIAFGGKKKIIAIGVLSDTATFGTFTVHSKGDLDGFLATLRIP